MARTKEKKSSLSFMGLGLTPEEDKQLTKLLKDSDLTARTLIRKLLRHWIDEAVNQ